MPGHRSALMLWHGGIVMLLLANSPAMAQTSTCWKCKSEPDPEFGYVHLDDIEEPWAATASPPDGRHEDWGEDCCFCVHEPECTIGGGEEDTDEAREAMRLLLNAISTGQTGVIVRVYTRLATRAILNPQRRAIQIMSCRDAGIVSMHLPLSSETFRALQDADVALSGQTRSRR